MAIPLHKRRKVADFDPVRDGKTVTQFCKELAISRQAYHNIKNRIAQKGRAGIVPDSTAPKNPIKKFHEADKIAVVHARQQLMEQGLDYGPWSIYYFLFDTVGPDFTPSRSTIASWLHELGFVEPTPANGHAAPISASPAISSVNSGRSMHWSIASLTTPTHMSRFTRSSMMPADSMPEPQRSLCQKTVLMRALCCPQRFPPTANLKRYTTLADATPCAGRPTLGIPRSSGSDSRGIRSVENSPYH